MLRSEIPTARGPGRQRVALNGQWHLIIDLRTLEGLGYDVRGSVTYPDPAPGWATTRIGTTRFCAWFEGVA